MKKEKQELTLLCLQCGKYKIEEDRVMYKTVGTGHWSEMAYGVLPGGYSQVQLTNSKRGKKNVSIRVYKHVVIYLANYGLYPEGFHIDHIDRDKDNNHPSNLRAVTAKANSDNKEPERMRGGEIRTIRSNDIAQIRELHAKGFSQSAIAKMLNKNRLTIRYTIKNIEAGRVMKYEVV